MKKFNKKNKKGKKPKLLRLYSAAKAALLAMMTNNDGKAKNNDNCNDNVLMEELSA